MRLLLLFVVAVAAVAASAEVDVVPSKTVVEAARTQASAAGVEPVVVVSAAAVTKHESKPEGWQDSKQMFASSQEAPKSFLSVLHDALMQHKSKLADLVREKVSMIANGGKSHAVTSSAAQQPPQPQKQQEEVQTSLSTFNQAFQNGLGERVVAVIEKEGTTGNGARVVEEMAVVLPATVNASSAQGLKLAQHLAITAALAEEKKREGLVEIKLQEGEDPTAPEVDDEEDDDEEDEEESLAAAPQAGVTVAGAAAGNVPQNVLESKEVAERVGSVLGKLFRSLAEREQQQQQPQAAQGVRSVVFKAGDQPSSDNNNNHNNNNPAVQVGAMQEWAMKQLEEMQDIVNLREELRNRHQMMSFDPLMGNGMLRAPFHHRRRRHHDRRDHHSRRQHRGMGFHPHPRIGHRFRHQEEAQERRQFASILNHLMHDTELPAQLSSPPQLIPLPDGHVALQLHVEQ